MDHLQPCLIEPMLPSLFWGGGFTAFHMIQGGNATPQVGHSANGQCHCAAGAGLKATGHMLLLPLPPT